MVTRQSLMRMRPAFTKRRGGACSRMSRCVGSREGRGAEVLSAGELEALKAVGLIGDFRGNRATVRIR